MSGIHRVNNSQYLDVLYTACDLKRTIRAAQGLGYNIENDRIRVSSDHQSGAGIVLRAVTWDAVPAQIYTPIGCFNIKDEGDPEILHERAGLKEQNKKIQEFLKDAHCRWSHSSRNYVEQVHALKEWKGRNIHSDFSDSASVTVGQDVADQMFKDMLSVKKVLNKLINPSNPL